MQPSPSADPKISDKHGAYMGPRARRRGGERDTPMCVTPTHVTVVQPIHRCSPSSRTVLTDSCFPEYIHRYLRRHRLSHLARPTRRPAMPRRRPAGPNTQSILPGAGVRHDGSLHQPLCPQACPAMEPPSPMSSCTGEDASQAKVLCCPLLARMICCSCVETPYTIISSGPLEENEIDFLRSSMIVAVVICGNSVFPTSPATMASK